MATPGLPRQAYQSWLTGRLSSGGPLNFFAHAVVALRREQSPRWVIGAMAPDFASMAGLRLRSPEGQGALALGVAFHHRSDDAFHGACLFVELMKAAKLDLRERGLSAGPSLAIGHVGVELLLDGVLVDRDGVPDAYRLAVAEAASVAPELAFRADDQAAARSRWGEVCGRIADAPLPQGYQDPAFVAERLIRILARRKRLAVDPGREDAVFEWAEAFRPRVAASAEALLAQVESRLAAS